MLDRGLMTSPEDEDDLVVEMLSSPLGLSFAPVCSPWKANHQMVKRWSMGRNLPRNFALEAPAQFVLFLCSDQEQDPV